MLKSIVTCTRIDEICPSKLFNGPKSLKLTSVDDFHTQRMNFNVAMNRVIKNLQFIFVFLKLDFNFKNSTFQRNKLFVTQQILSITQNAKIHKKTTYKRNTLF